MAKEMLINVSEGEECRIALLEDDKLEELYMERTSSTSHVGNIYKGRVTNVEPSIQAAFVDFGLGRNGFLHISDLMPSYFGRRGDDYTEAVGRKMSRRDRPPIQRCLRRGDDITVQIIKEGIGTKGPTLTTYLSIPGRILVMMPGMSKFGISRKIEDEVERRRLRGILDGLKPIEDVGFIIRTAGVGKTKTEIERDLKYLTRLWENISKKMKEPAPVELYTEGDLVTRTVRDVFTTDVERIVVDNKEVARRVREFFKIAMPRTKNKVELYEDPVPLFHRYDIEREIEQMYSRHVPLPSGGSLVIDSTEAIVAIDVNSGKFRDHSDAETTAFKTDMEAADEIPRQLRLRDLGGVIICDFIDLRFERHRRDLERKLHDNLKKDRAKTKVLRMSQFGIIEMTRQRMRPSLKRSIYSDCPHCHGSGLVKTPESMSLDVMRKLAIAINDQRVARVELAVCPDVALYLLNKKRAPLAELEAQTKKRIIVRHDHQLGLDEMRLQLFDMREGLVFLDALGMTPHDAVLPAQGGGGDPRRQQNQQQQGRRDGGGGGGRGGRGDRGGRNQGQGAGRRDDRAGGGGYQQGRRDDRNRQPNRQGAGRDQEDERFELENVEEAVDQRETEQADRAITPAPTFASSSTRDADDRAAAKRGEPPHDENESDNVIELDDADEPMGEAPGEIADDSQRSRQDRDRGAGREQDNFGSGGGGRRRRRRRGRRGRGRNNNGGTGQPEFGNAEPAGSESNDEQAERSGDESSSHEEPGESEDSDRDVVEVGVEQEPTAPPPVEEEESSEAETEAASSEADADAGESDSPAREGGKRRRRRGGRRHRRKAGDAAEPATSARKSADEDDAGNSAPPPPAPRASEENEEDDEEDNIGNRIDEPPPAPKTPPTRRGRGGGGRRAPGGGRGSGGGGGGGSRSANPQRVPPRNAAGSSSNVASGGGGSGAANIPPLPPVPRTGSSDKHLISTDDDDSTDEIAAEPVRRPRSYRDLDFIPDDEE